MQQPRPYNHPAPPLQFESSHTDEREGGMRMEDAQWDGVACTKSLWMQVALKKVVS